MGRWSISVILLLATASWLGANATEYAPRPTKETMAGSWISVTSGGDVFRLVLDKTGVGEYAYDLGPGDVRIYDVKVPINDYKIRIDATVRDTSETHTIRGSASDDRIWIDWSKKTRQRFQREAVFDRSLHDLRAAMRGSVRDDVD